MDKIKRFIALSKEFYSWAISNPKKALIALALSSGIVLLMWVFLEFIIFPILGVAFLIWGVFDFPRPNIPKLQPPIFDSNVCDDFMTEILSEKHDLLGIRKPIDKTEIKMYPSIVPKGNIQIYQCKATQTENAPIDEDSIEERRLILQERITEKLQAGMARIDVVAFYFPNIPTLYVDEVAVRGNKFIFDIIWAVDRAERDYIMARREQKQGADKGCSTDDEDF